MPTVSVSEELVLGELTGRPAWKRLLLANPDLFILRYFPDKIAKLEPFHLESIEVATEARRGLLLLPAQHGKTTLVSTLLPIWAVCKNPNIRLAIIGKNDSEAEGIMRAIQSELIQNDLLVEDFGPFFEKGSERPWALGMLSVARRTVRHKEQNITVFGSGARTTLGHRTDWTICDDVVTQENSATPEQRYKIKRWFNQSVATMPVPSGRSRLTVVGTMFDPNDLYNDQLLLQDSRGKPLWRHLRLDALVNEDTHETLWPDVWPWPLLMEKKIEIGTLDFNKRYRNIAVDESRMVFREEYIRGGFIGREQYDGCLDQSYSLGDLEPDWRRAGGFDPAIGVKRQAKFCAHVVLASGSCGKHERCLWVVDLIRDQMSLQQQVQTIIEQHQHYSLQTSKIEVNAFQRGLLEAVQTKMGEMGIALKIEEHTTNRANKPDPEIGIQALSPWFERGQIHIPWRDPYSRRKMQVLVDELIQYPGRTTDTVMALWFAWLGLDAAKPPYRASNYLAKPLFAVRQPGRRVLKNPYYAEER